MAMYPKALFKRDSEGIAHLLKSDQFGDAVYPAADAAAHHLRRALIARGSSVLNSITVTRRTTDRVGVDIVIRDQRAAAWQVRDRIFDQAAAAAGLGAVRQVRGR